ncbi:fibronectin type III domain-containing protein [Micromonospora sp. WP24]|uniref:fibronectin type III domain-containing protein n=1 Tax=Micromonospora sp. WP24 TaxID=2604469 RepID=UPI0011D8BBE8|nr:fibronectin type III domain-containing protein [Micromonospora sp. WP24]TYB95011.1 fibronectin type III domain-containing protein [Micromonospora sp. WP24]
MATIDDAVQTGSGTPRRRRRPRGGLVTIATVVALLAAMGLTVHGLGAADNAVSNYDASSWLWSAGRSELARVNGVTARVDTRTEVPGTRRHPMEVTQTDRLLILRDLSTGQVSSLDLATLQITATTRTTPGLGVNVALHEDAAFVVDAVQGVVRQLDPRSLAPVGEPVRYPPGITGGAFDGAGRLWIAVPSEGTVSAITAADLPDTPASAAAEGGGGLSPERVETYDVADPAHELVVSTLDDGVAVLDRTAGALVTVHGGKVRPTTLTTTAPGALPARTSGSMVPVTVPGQRRVHVVAEGGGEVGAFTVPGSGDRLRPAVAWADRFYCADEATGLIYAFDAQGRLVDTIRGRSAGPLELEVRENYLFINAPDSATARVVDDKHQVREVDKYANDVLGGDPPPAPPPPPPPKKPKVGKPGAPRSVTATAGNAQARVSWRPAPANGAEIIRYVVEGAGQRREVGANQRAVEIKGLTNGETYRFSVHAVNAKGAGPPRSSNRVTPTAAVPDPPARVTAQARADGTVVVRWPAANGQGNRIARYAVTASSAGANAPAGESTKTELVVPAGELEFGRQYAFTVSSVNNRGVASAASPVSNTVVPYTAPGRPTDLRAATVPDRPGTVSLQWAPAEPNGRPVAKYLVDVGGRSLEVTDTRATVDGLGNGRDVTVRVKAVNEAGPGPESTATARTVAEPRVTVTGSSATTTSATVTFTVDAGGGKATCTLSTPGKPAKSGGCSALTVSGLSPGTSYTFTVTASNAAGRGTTTRAQATDALYGIATCKNGDSGEEATYCDRDVDGRNGNEIFAVTRQDNDRQVGWAKPGTRLKAYCKKRGEEVYAYIYNREKRSTWWVQVAYEGKNYIPWAWLNLEGGDNINVLPTC